MSNPSSYGETGAKSKLGYNTNPVWNTANDPRKYEDEEEYMGTAPHDIIPEPERTGCWYCVTRAVKGKLIFVSLFFNNFLILA